MDKKLIGDVIQELDGLISRAEELKTDFYHFYERNQLYQHKDANGTKVTKALDASYSQISRLREASDALKIANIEEIRAYVVSWYMGMHWDIRPRKEISEENLMEPSIETISYQGKDTFEIIMTSVTHGRERIIINSDTCSWNQVYSAEYIGGE